MAALGQTRPYRRSTRRDGAVIRKSWRILEGLTTNNVKVEFPRKGIVLSQGGKGGSDWFGHHALEWCRSDPEYMLNAQRRRGRTAAVGTRHRLSSSAICRRPRQADG